MATQSTAEPVSLSDDGISLTSIIACSDSTEYTIDALLYSTVNNYYQLYFAVHNSTDTTKCCQLENTDKITLVLHDDTVKQNGVYYGVYKDYSSGSVSGGLYEINTFKFGANNPENPFEYNGAVIKADLKVGNNDEWGAVYQYWLYDKNKQLGSLSNRTFTFNGVEYIISFLGSTNTEGSKCYIGISYKEDYDNGNVCRGVKINGADSVIYIAVNKGTSDYCDYKLYSATYNDDESLTYLENGCGYKFDDTSSIVFSTSTDTTDNVVIYIFPKYTFDIYPGEITNDDISTAKKITTVTMTAVPYINTVSVMNPSYLKNLTFADYRTYTGYYNTNDATKATFKKWSNEATFSTTGKTIDATLLSDKTFGTITPTTFNYTTDEDSDNDDTEITGTIECDIDIVSIKRNDISSNLTLAKPIEQSFSGDIDIPNVFNYDLSGILDIMPCKVADIDSDLYISGGVCYTDLACTAYIFNTKYKDLDGNIIIYKPKAKSYTFIC